MPRPARVPTCPGSASRSFRTMTTEEETAYHGRTGRWPLPSQVVCEICGAIVRGMARGYDEFKVCKHTLPDTLELCDRHAGRIDRCPRCNGTGVRRRSHSHGDPSLQCTDPYCRHPNDRFRHTTNCDPDPSVPCYGAVVAEDEVAPVTPEDFERIRGMFGPFPVRNVVTHPDGSVTGTVDVSAGVGRIVTSAAMAPGRFALTTDGKVWAVGRVPNDPDPITTELHCRAIEYTRDLRALCAMMTLPPEVGGEFHTLLDVVGLHLDTLDQHIRNHHTLTRRLDETNMAPIVLPDRHGSAGTKFCLCSDPDYCLRNTDPATRERAIAYRRDHAAPLPTDVKGPHS